MVKFCGYGNTEEQYLDDLLLPISKKNRKSPKPSSSQPVWPTSPGQQVIVIIINVYVTLHLEEKLSNFL